MLAYHRKTKFNRIHHMEYQQDFELFNFDFKFCCIIFKINCNYLIHLFIRHIENAIIRENIQFLVLFAIKYFISQLFELTIIKFNLKNYDVR